MINFDIPFLDKLLTQTDLEFLRGLAVRRSFSDGEMIQDRGDADPVLALVVRGKVKLVTPLADGREIFTTVINPGQNYGDIALMTGQVKRVHRAIAVGDTEVDIVAGATVGALLDRPSIVTALYKVASARLGLLMALLDDMRAHPPEVRLARVLLLMQGNERGGRIDFGQEDVANLLGVSTVTLAKALKMLKKEGLIATGYRQISIPDGTRLMHWMEQRATL
ncbi:MAG: Crp/Fnr family transcriptional regulator [Novosphingobium sp.]